MVTAIAYVITCLAGAAAGGTHHSSARNGIGIALVVLLAFLAAMTAARPIRSARLDGQAPKNASAHLSFALGFLVLGCSLPASLPQ